MKSNVNIYNLKQHKLKVKIYMFIDCVLALRSTYLPGFNTLACSKAEI